MGDAIIAGGCGKTEADLAHIYKCAMGGGYDAEYGTKEARAYHDLIIRNVKAAQAEADAST